MENKLVLGRIKEEVKERKWVGDIKRKNNKLLWW
jgi:hypothetical protein